MPAALEQWKELRGATAAGRYGGAERASAGASGADAAPTAEASVGDGDRGACGAGVARLSGGGWRRWCRLSADGGAAVAWAPMKGVRWSGGEYDVWAHL